MTLQPDQNRIHRPRITRARPYHGMAGAQRAATIDFHGISAFPARRP
ncbi:hypothetical protein [Sphingomonas colocasiae]|uniref:Uncharacterized protein n=1 Tax=Sphingomonas colocasiae TaxID=1848973 RepID=A0ABS7PL82_9SPHN|nr:hypothetical protein [Sphingomonas colocasiae]MBY8821988.1 hypothetical protein [Sphingomonas colocasiae]